MPESQTWDTRITSVEPNSILVRGYPLQELIGRKGILEVCHLLVEGELPEPEVLATLESQAKRGARLPPPQTSWDRGEDVSKVLARCLLMDRELLGFSGPKTELAAFTLGRVTVYLAWLFDHLKVLSQLEESEPFLDHLMAALTGEPSPDGGRARLMEAMVVGSTDHGVTPPSAQATILAAAVRASYEVCIAQGVAAITDVHGGAGAAAATFFTECVRRAETDKIELDRALREVLGRYLEEGKRVKGLGHRLHTQDPRRNVLWALAKETGLAGKHTEASKLVAGIFEGLKGRELPINVDGVIGALIADLGMEPAMAKVLFILGRVCGLEAHYFEEVETQRPMRRIDFSGARYTGPGPRSLL
jgi:citrate synthase